MPASRFHRPTLLLAALVLAAPVMADTVLKKNGEQATGLIIAESDKDITLQTHMEELIVRTKIARQDIAEIHKDPHAENRYCRIPIHGEIGVEVKAAWLAKALQEAAAFNANYIVLDIDSPGGQIGEMVAILDLLQKQKKFTLVAHVHRAMSAAAMIALICPFIVVDPRATIGAAVPWTMGPDGTPKDVEAKFFSAFRAQCKAAADTGHHSSLIARGMMEMDLVLSVTGSGIAAQVVDGQPAGSTPLKKAGEILCLSATEALNCGFAVGTADSAADIQKVLNRQDWAAVGETLWAYLESRPALEKANAARRAQARAPRVQQDQMTMLATVNARITTTQKYRDEAATRVSSLPLEYKSALNKIDPTLTPAQHDAKAAEIRAHYDPLYIKAQDDLHAATLELQDLQRLKGTLTAQLHS